MDARIVKENAKRESEEMQELERHKIMEKRDIFMSKAHNSKRKKRLLKAS